MLQQSINQSNPSNLEQTLEAACWRENQFMPEAVFATIIIQQQSINQIDEKNRAIPVFLNQSSHNQYRKIKK